LWVLAGVGGEDQLLTGACGVCLCVGVVMEDDVCV